ncbi:MAG: hypothetical protein ACTSSJ_02590 [Candidatus Odinarchaeia archaeon]
MAEIGSKILGWIAGVAILFGVTYLMLPAGYQMIVTWLGSVITYLPIILTALYAMLGSYTDTFHLALLFGACFVGGLIAATGKGGAAVGILTFFSMILIMVIAGVLTYLDISNDPTKLAQLGSLFDLTSLPPGVDIFVILQAPIIGDILNAVIDALFAGTPITIDALLPVIIQVVAVSFVVNLVVAIVSGIFGGKIGSLLSAPKAPEEEYLKPEFSPEEGVAGV